jgi:predicted P-loop ATPase
MGFVPLATYVPLGWSENGRPICSCFRGADCKNAGKHPIGPYSDIDTPDKGYAQVWHALQQETAKHLSVNLAIRSGPMSNIFVVDLDVKEGQDGIAQFQRWLGAQGLAIEQLDYTLRAKSGGGGLHFVFRHPKGVELNARNSGEEFGPGIDIKSTGMPFHVAPSVHKNGGYYGWLNWVQPGDAPEIIWRTAQKRQAAAASFDDAYTPTRIEVEEFADDLASSRRDVKKAVGRNMKALLQGQVIAPEGGGHDAFRDIAFFLMRKWPTASPDGLCSFLQAGIQARLDALPDSDTGYDDVLHSFHTAAQKVAEARNSWSGKVSVNDQGRPIVTAANLLLFFRNHPAWQGVFGYNLRRNRPVYLRPPPLERTTAAGDIDLSGDKAYIDLWFQHRAQMVGKISEKDVREAMVAAAKDQPFDPLYDLIKNLRGQWDGVPRLETALQRIAGTPDGEWPRIVFPTWMKSLVRRILEPGCKADSMLILEGAQGFKKSTFFSSLLPDTRYFSDSLSKVRHDVESIRLIHSGPCIFELGELSGLRKQEIEDVKAFLSAFQDDLRPLYEPPRSTSRRCIFVGTTNRSDYLRDETGGRRFWPIKVTRPIDIEAVFAEREQWFAEALARLDAGEHWWLEGDAATALAQTEQEDRYEEDIWEQPIRAWLDDEAAPTNGGPATATEQMAAEANRRKAGKYVTTIQVALYACKVELKNARTAEGARINKILRRLGWVPDRVMEDGKQIRAWLRPNKEIAEGNKNNDGGNKQIINPSLTN